MSCRGVTALLRLRIAADFSTISVTDRGGMPVPLLCKIRKEESNSMERRTLGNSGLAIAPLIFGGNVFG